MQILGSAKTRRKKSKEKYTVQILKILCLGGKRRHKKILDRNKKRGKLLTQKYPVGKNNAFFKTSLCLISQK